ncbi:uncharacterized protein LOC116005854 [Ipomoea triloba]|uniref:uncharacterized protein LOC116005854 n=1 Tax=Ipomoea triloba TaxID=35885 RepID=UPI00125DCE9E|nr:uncharacterized protein LOC116005854 [Ipomoea triloba]
MTSPLIQKDIVNAIASETTEIIINDLGEELFGIIVDESKDISVTEQMIVFIPYVNSSGHIVEHMLGITHVRDTTSMSLKVAIEDLLTRHVLSISRIRSQGYDEASNMRALVDAARENSAVGNFFVTVSQLCNIVLDEIGVNEGPKQRTEAFGVLKDVLCFDFVFFLHLMKDVLGITNDLS